MSGKRVKALIFKEDVEGEKIQKILSHQIIYFFCVGDAAEPDSELSRAIEGQVMSSINSMEDSNDKQRSLIPCI